MIGAICAYLEALVRSHLEPEEGATAVEYAIMASLIAMVVIGAVAAIGIALSAKFDLVGPALG